MKTGRLGDVVHHHDGQPALHRQLEAVPLAVVEPGLVVLQQDGASALRHQDLSLEIPVLSQSRALQHSPPEDT